VQGLRPAAARKLTGGRLGQLYKQPEISKAVTEYTMKVDNMNELIPPLPDLEISGFAKKFIDHQDMDRAMRIIYERRPEFFLKSVERDKKREQDGDDEAFIHDGFHEELQKFIREEVRKEVKVPNLFAMTVIISHARAIARLMYG
jgi:hypothetical protein